MDNTGWVMPTHIIAGAGIVRNGKDEVLLVKTHNAGWVFPGGQVEVGENVIDAVKREIMEEAGIDIDVEEVFCISSNTGKYPGYNGIKEIPTKLCLILFAVLREEFPGHRMKIRNPCMSRKIRYWI